jgi:hypothetical protein
VGKFHADGSCANDDDGLWAFLPRQGVAAGDDALAVYRQPRDGASPGACGQDDVSGLQNLAAWLHSHAVRSEQPPLAFHQVDLVLLEQGLHPLD